MRKLRVALLVDSSRLYYRDILKGIAKYSQSHGLWLFYNEPSVDQKKTLSHLKGWGVDGMIVAVLDNKSVSKYTLPGVPTIVVMQKEYISGYINITGNFKRTGTIAAEYFLNKGFNNFGFCSWNDALWAVNRGKAFQERLANNGYKVHWHGEIFPRLHGMWEMQQQHLIKYLRDLPKPIAILACNDDCARHVLEACNRAEIHVPEQIAVLGVDNDDTVCNLTYPPLSSVAVNAAKAGFEAAQALHNLMQKKPYNHDIIVEPLQVVTRHSTDVLAIEDTDVASAIAFIRQNASKVITVADVVAATSLSRRQLERRFHTTIGRTIHKEIRKSRADMIANMLANTDLNISEISNIMGYYEDGHLRRYFQQEMGLSPSAYRRRYCSIAGSKS